MRGKLCSDLHRFLRSHVYRWRSKERTLELLNGILASEEELITSAEVFKEILHRYISIKNAKYLNAAYEVLEELCDQVIEVRKEDCDQARLFTARFPNISSRDCLHSAIIYKPSPIHFCKKMNGDSRAQINKTAQSWRSQVAP